MDRIQKALENLRACYSRAGRMPSPQKICEHILAQDPDYNISIPTIQRYLSGDDLKSPNYNKILAIGRVIGMESPDLQLDERILRDMDNVAMQDTVIELRKMNIVELADNLQRNDALWRERIQAQDDQRAIALRQLYDRHDAELDRVSAAHDREIERLRSEHADEIARIRSVHDGHISRLHDNYRIQIEQAQSLAKDQIDHVRATDRLQLETLQSIAATQSASDERIKTYLKRQILFWRILTFVLLALLVALIVSGLLRSIR